MLLTSRLPEAGSLVEGLPAAPWRCCQTSRARIAEPSAPGPVLARSPDPASRGKQDPFAALWWCNSIDGPTTRPS